MAVSCWELVPESATVSIAPTNEERQREKERDKRGNLFAILNNVDRENPCLTRWQMNTFTRTCFPPDQITKSNIPDPTPIFP